MVEPFSCIVPYIKRVTFCFVPPLMNTTTWLLKHLAIINQFWLVKSGNRLSMSTPSHKGFFSCTATVSMGYMYLLLKGCIIFNRFRLFEAFMPLSLRFLIHSQSPYPCTTNFNTIYGLQSVIMSTLVKNCAYLLVPLQHESRSVAQAQESLTHYIAQML